MESAALAPSTAGFRTIERPEIPSLAWLFSFDEDEPTLVHGSNVDIFPQGFFEGCFAGEFGSDPRLAANVFGSGMWHADDAWHVITPSHTLEAVYVLSRNGVRGVSNSLPFLVEYFCIEVPFSFAYPRIALSVQHGIDKYQRQLFVRNADRVERFLYRNLRIDEGGALVEVDKPKADVFDTYDSYTGYLIDVLRQAFRHAADLRRPSEYTPIGAMSSGYDSSASTALGVRAGCTEGITIWRPRRGGGSDSGKPVGDALGIVVHEFDRPKPDQMAFPELAEFFATGMPGDDHTYLVFEERLRSRVLLSGTYGDKVWRFHYEPNEVLNRTGSDAASFHEFRLRTGFFHIPVPMIGARRLALIREIASSPEMEPYSVSGEYNAPISRRILEEMGVPRSAFGQVKRASSSVLAIGRRVRVRSSTRKGLAKDAQREIETRARNKGIDLNSPKFWFALVRWHLMYVYCLGIEYLVNRVPSLAHRYGERAYRSRFQLGHSHPDNAVMFLVSLDELQRRYTTGGED